MQLNSRQLGDFDRDGYVLLPRLFSVAEVATLRADTDRLSGLAAEGVKRERSGAVRSILHAHEIDGSTHSATLRALTRTPRLMEPVVQLLGDSQVYIHHSRIDFKAAFEGRVHSWHQAYGKWRRDGMKAPRPIIAMVMLDDAEEIAGALYFAPGSHRHGELIHRKEPGADALPPLVVERRQLARLLALRKPVPILGSAGSVVLFHCNLIHGSGHNMSARDLRQIYIAYNPMANKPLTPEKAQSDFEGSHSHAPIAMGRDEDILTAMDNDASVVARHLWPPMSNDDNTRDGAVYH